MSYVSSIIDTLEESELGWIRGLRRVQGLAQILNSNVRVSNNFTTTVESLRSSIIGGIGVGERTSLETLGLDSDVEILTLLDGRTKLGEGDDAGNHLILSWDETHGNTITRTSCDLQAVGKLLARAEVDEVVLGCLGQSLAILGTQALTTIEEATRLHSVLVQGK